MSTARAIIEVTAGLVPGQPMPELTKRWAITSDEWHEANQFTPTTPAEEYAAGPASTLLAERQGQAHGYAALLMLQPDRYNWVRTDWIWL